jgi:hypothetical protein
MAAVANNPEFAKKAGVPQSVGKEFNQADKGRKFSKGGDMKSEAMKKGGMPMKMKDGKKIPAFAAKKGGMAKMAAGGATKMGAVKTNSRPDGVIKQGGTKGTMITMAKGGKAMKSGGKTC